jgi:hypothetical protein
MSYCSLLKAACPENPTGILLFSSCSLLRVTFLKQTLESFEGVHTETNRKVIFKTKKVG